MPDLRPLMVSDAQRKALQWLINNLSGIKFRGAGGIELTRAGQVLNIVNRTRRQGSGEGPGSTASPPDLMLVALAADGGLAGDSGSVCTLTYTASDLAGTPMGTGLSPLAERQEEGERDAATHGIGFIDDDTGEFQLVWPLNEERVISGGGGGGASSVSVLLATASGTSSFGCAIAASGSTYPRVYKSAATGTMIIDITGVTDPFGLGRPAAIFDVGQLGASITVASTPIWSDGSPLNFVLEMETVVESASYSTTTCTLAIGSGGPGGGNGITLGEKYLGEYAARRWLYDNVPNILIPGGGTYTLAAPDFASMVQFQNYSSADHLTGAHIGHTPTLTTGPSLSISFGGCAGTASINTATCVLFTP